MFHPSVGNYLCVECRGTSQPFELKGGRYLYRVELTNLGLHVMVKPTLGRRRVKDHSELLRRGSLGEMASSVYGTTISLEENSWSLMNVGERKSIMNVTGVSSEPRMRQNYSGHAMNKKLPVTRHFFDGATTVSQLVNQCSVACAQ